MIVTISRKEAQKMAVARLIIIIPSALIGIIFGLYSSGARLSLGSLLVVILVVLSITAASIYIGMRIGMKKQIGTSFRLESDFLQKTLNDGKITIINLNEGITIQENSMGLTAKDRIDKIFIPKQIEMYAELKMELEKRVK